MTFPTEWKNKRHLCKSWLKILQTSKNQPEKKTDELLPPRRHIMPSLQGSALSFWYSIRPGTSYQNFEGRGRIPAECYTFMINSCGLM